MATLNIYLTFKDNCEEAFEFYKSVFGTEYQSFNRFSEMPENEEFPVSEDDKHKVMHVSLPVSHDSVLMGSDTVGGHQHGLITGNNFSISFHTIHREEADSVFGALSKGGKVTMPLADTFWGSYFGSLTDRFGINWMISCNLGQN